MLAELVGPLDGLDGKTVEALLVVMDSLHEAQDAARRAEEMKRHGR